MSIETSIQSKLSFPWYKSTFPIFKNSAYFSVTPIALNDVNVRGGNAIKPFAREIGTYRYSRKRGNESENYGYVIHAC